MVYLDPPFFSQCKQTLRDVKGNKYEFTDLWNSRGEYLEYIKLRLLEIKKVLKPTGTIFLHCDTSASHYLRILLDNIFGENNFRSEIIWTYKRWSNSKKGLLPAHQTIFFYSKTNKFFFNTLYGDYSPTTNIDQILQERERNEIGKVSYKYDENGNTVMGKEKKGVPITDVWEIPFLNPKAKERVGYPTQKPVELLERIIKISTKEGDVVLDPFCGSGTTLVASKLLNRDFIGIDINSDAIELCEKRLETPFKTTSNLLNAGISAYKTKTEEELAILKQFDCVIVQRNKGIDAFLKKYYLDAPVAIKIQKKDEHFSDAVKALYMAGMKKNCSFMIFITNEIDWQSKEYNIPMNVIVLNTYESQFTEIVERKLLQKAL